MCSALYLRCQILWIRCIDQHYRWSTIYIVVFTSESVWPSSFFFWKGTCIPMNEMECMELHARASEPHSWENKCGNLPIQENWVITWPYTASNCNPRMCGNLPIQENWVIMWPYTASDCNPRMWIEANRFSSHCLTLISIDSECGGDAVPSFVENNRVSES